MVRYKVLEKNGLGVWWVGVCEVEMGWGNVGCVWVVREGLVVVEEGKFS